MSLEIFDRSSGSDSCSVDTPMKGNRKLITNIMEYNVNTLQDIDRVYLDDGGSGVDLTVIHSVDSSYVIPDGGDTYMFRVAQYRLDNPPEAQTLSIVVEFVGGTPDYRGIVVYSLYDAKSGDPDSDEVSSTTDDTAQVTLSPVETVSIHILCGISMGSPPITGYYGAVIDQTAPCGIGDYAHAHEERTTSSSDIVGLTASSSERFIIAASNIGEDIDLTQGGPRFMPNFC